MRKYILGVLALALTVTMIFAFTAPNRSKVAKEKPFATGVFQYLGGDVNAPSSYGTVQINPADTCPVAGSKRCAATFTLSGSTRTGNPMSPIWTKP